MADPRYTYDRVNVVKVIIQNKERNILLIREPLTNAWMPGHWGLPGGKPLAQESLLSAYTRKMKEELGIDTEPTGIYRIEELLIEGRTVLMFIFVTNVDDITVQGESNEYRWVTKDDLSQMPIDVFTEFYNKKLLTDYLEKEPALVPLTIIESFRYYEMLEDKEYRSWLDSGKNK